MKNPSRGLQAFPVVVSTFLVFLTFSSLAAAQRQPVITAIDDTDRVTLKHTTHPLAQVGAELSPAEPGMRIERMLLVLGPSGDVQPQLRALIDSQHDKKSANFHKWLTPEQFGERFGPSQQDINAVTSWLQQKGFDTIKPARGRGTIEFSGTVGAVQQAFGTQMHYYQFKGEKHLANSSDISIPRAMSGVVRGVNLQNFTFSKPSLVGPFPVARNSSGKLVRTDPGANTGNGSNFLAPGDYANIYDINPLYKNNIDGTGISIAVVARTNIELADVETFRQAFNLPAKDPEIVLNGQDPGQVLSGDIVEASLDTEWTGALAPNADIKLVVSASTPVADGAFLSEVYIVDNNLADIMSVSFNACEQEFTPDGVAFFNALYQQAAAQGMSVFVDTGDAGAADCEFAGFNGGPATTGLAVNLLASTPFDTAVGGTEFDENGNQATYWSPTTGPGFVSALGYIPEMVWNESCDPTVNPNCFPPGSGLFTLAGTGGGVSTVYPKPSWQSTTLTGVPNDNARDLPDVSLTAATHDGYIFCVTLFEPCVLSNTGKQVNLDSAGIVSGTSASAQTFAAFMALIDQQQGGRQGLANYVLYKLAAQETFSNCNSSNRTDPTQPAPAGCIFNDTTVGNNGVPGNDTLSAPVPPGDTVGQVGYNATPGYDSATGLGSVDLANLAAAWNSVTFLGTSTTLAASGSTSVQHGQEVSFNVNVAPLSGSGTPSGAFVLIAKNAPVAFNNTQVGSGILTDGAFSGTINTLPGGEYQVVAHYGGDGTFGGSESAVVPVNISPESSGVTISGNDQNGTPFSSPGSMTLSYGFGQFFLVTVTSASGNTTTPTGTVTLSDGTTQLGTLALDNNGQALFTNCNPTSVQFCLNIGTHNLTAVYSGDNSNTTSTSSVLVATVIKGNAQFGSIITCCIEDQSVEMGADFSTGTSVLGIPPTGTVSFTDTFNGTTTTLGSQTLTPGAIIIEYFNVSVGDHTLGIQYSGDNNYLPTGVTAPITTRPLADPSGVLPVVTLSTSTNPIVEGQPITLTVNVSSNQTTAIPTGTIFVTAGAAFVNPTSGGFTLSNGTLTFTGIMPNATTMLQAFYNGDSNFNPTASAPLDISVAKIDPTLNLSTSAASVQAGAQVSLVATMSGPPGSGAPQGLLQFFDSVNGGTAQLLGNDQILLTVASGSASATSTASITPALPVGTNTITVNYSGDGNFNSITQSNSVTITVNAGSPAAFALTTPSGGDTLTINKGQSGQFNVFLNADGFSGTVSLNCTGAPAGTSCTANPNSVDLSADVTSVPVVVNVAPSTSASVHFLSMPFMFAIVLGVAPLGFRRRRWTGKALMLVGAMCLVAGMTACGSSSRPAPPPPTAKTYTLTLTGTAGSTSTSIPLTLTVNP